MIRVTYLLVDGPVAGDGYDFYVKALRLADGLGYTSDVGAESAHHPPGWTSLLGAISWLGFRDPRAHQVVGLAIGVLVVVIAGLVGRRFVNDRVGVWAAVLAAVYPGFWILDTSVLSEPLALLIGGLLLLVLADLWERPTVTRALLTGAVMGLLALVRAEQLLLLVIVVVPVLVFNRRVSARRRVGFVAIVGAVTAAVIAPWSLYNLGRFEEPVLISSNLGSTMLAGNCAITYEGERLGFYDARCVLQVSMRSQGLDTSELDPAFREAAFDNMFSNVGRMPAVVLARHGRMLGVFRPSQTVDFVSEWMQSERWTVWAWIVSVWVLVPLAVYGGVAMWRAKIFMWPLVAPMLIVFVFVTLTYGEPRYHTPADLGLVVLGAAGVSELTNGFGRQRP